MWHVKNLLIKISLCVALFPSEEDWRIHVVGAPALDIILNEKLPTRQELFKTLRIGDDQLSYHGAEGLKVQSSFRGDLGERKIGGRNALIFRH